MAGAVAPSNPAESDRFEAQRKLLGGLLARFTADRDALITSVQECQQQLVALAARLEGTSAPSAAPTGVSAPQVDDLRRMVEQVQQQQKQAETEVRNLAEHAMLRADEALRGLDELAAARPAAAESEGWKHEQAETRANSAGEQALARVDEAVRGLEELRADRSAHEETTRQLARWTEDREALSAAVRDTEQRLTASVEQLGATVARALESATQALDRVDHLANTPRAETVAPEPELSERTGETTLLPESETQLQQLIIELRESQQQIALNTEQALARADDAQRAVKDLAAARRAAAPDPAQRAPVQTAALSKMVDGLRADLDQLGREAAPVVQRQAMAHLAQRVGALEVRLGASLRHPGAPVQRASAWQRWRSRAAAAAAIGRTAKTASSAATAGAVRRRPFALAAHIAGPATAALRRTWSGGRPAWSRQLRPALAGFAVLALLVSVGVVDAARRRSAALRETVEPPANAGAPAQPQALDTGAPVHEAETFAAGVAALRTHDLAAAATAFERVATANPESPEARNNLAVVLVERGDAAAAAEQLRTALRLRPDYQRARTNLARVDALLAAQAAAHKAAAPAEAPPPVEPAAVTAPQPSEPELVVAALDSDAINACVIEPGQNRVCIAQRSGDAVALDICYPFTTTGTERWPRWVLAGERTATRLTLLDEAAQPQLELAAEGGDAHSVLQLSRADFAALSAHLLPWHSACVVQPQAATPAPPGSTAALRQALEQWRHAWEGKRFDEYAGLYGSAFIPQLESDPADWRAHKRSVFEHSGSIAVDIAAASVFVATDGSAAVTVFEQTYRSRISASRGTKVLSWRHVDDRWSIERETIVREERLAVQRIAAR